MAGLLLGRDAPGFWRGWASSVDINLLVGVSIGTSHPPFRLRLLGTSFLSPSFGEKGGIFWEKWGDFWEKSGIFGVFLGLFGVFFEALTGGTGLFSMKLLLRTVFFTGGGRWFSAPSLWLIAYSGLRRQAPGGRSVGVLAFMCRVCAKGT
jgi:hypothetical protein